MKLWRNLCRVISIHEYFVVIVVPGWDSDAAFPVWSSQFPKHMLKSLQPGCRFIANVTLGAERIEDMRIEEIDAHSLTAPNHRINGGSNESNEI